MNPASSESPAKRIFQAVIAVIGWFALVIDFWNSGRHLANYLSYFTILSNLIIAISLSIASISPRSGTGRMMSGYSYQTALAVYILIVSLIYNFVLRGSYWGIRNWPDITNNLLHILIPLLYFIYWLIYIPKGSLKWKDNLKWLSLPLAYMFYTLIRGEVIHRYPYPFVDVNKLGYGQVIINIVYVALGFVLMGFCLILINRIRFTRQPG